MKSIRSVAERSACCSAGATATGGASSGLWLLRGLGPFMIVFVTVASQPIGSCHSDEPRNQRRL